MNIEDIVTILRPLRLSLAELSRQLNLDPRTCRKALLGGDVSRSVFLQVRELVVAAYKANAPLSPAEIDALVKRYIESLFDQPPPDLSPKPENPTPNAKSRRGSSESGRAPSTAQPSSVAVAAAPVGFSAPVKKTPSPDWTSADLLEKKAAARVRARLTDDVPNVRALRAKFCDDIRAQAPTWLGDSTTDGAINAKLRRAGSVTLRSRAKDAGLAERKAVAANFTLRYAAQIESDGHSKGAYQNRSWMDLRATLLGLWKVDAFKNKVTELLGREPSYHAFERIFRDEFGKVSPAERAAEKYFQPTHGLLTEYCGQHLEMDASEFPIKVLDAWGRSRANGEIAHPFAALLDRGSLKAWTICQGDTSEVYLWSPLLLKFFEAEQYAPEKIIMDEGGRGFKVLRQALKWAQEGKELPLDPGQRLALAVGVEPYCHSPHHPAGKGLVESAGMKVGKSTMKKVLVCRFAKALIAEIKSAPSSYREVHGEAVWQEILREWELALNSRVVKRIGDGTLTRDAAYLLPDHAARRNERRLADGWQEQWRRTVAQGFVMEVRGENTLYWKGARAEVRTPLGRPVQAGAAAILFPGNLRAGDDQHGGDLLRGVIVEQTGGQPIYHQIEAVKVAKTFLGFETDRNKAGAHPIAIPETEHQRRQRAWVEAGKQLPMQEAAQKKEATTGKYI